MASYRGQAPWSAFFMDFAKTYQGNEAQLTIRGQLGDDREEKDWLPLTSLSYNPHHDQICITAGSLSSCYFAPLTYTIDRPKMVHISYTPAGDVYSILVVASDKSEILVRRRV